MATEQNCTDNQPITVTPSGDIYLANVVTQLTNKGSMSCPWAINASQGQIVTFTLVDFAFRSPVSGSSLPNETHRGELCFVYGEISEQSLRGEQRKVLICGGTEARETVIYTSSSNGGIISLTTTHKEVYFLVKVSGKSCSCLLCYSYVRQVRQWLLYVG